MKFQQTLVHGRLIKRYKRFLVDIQLDDGSIATAHCTNSGSMKTCLEENAEVWLSPVNNPKRKTRYTWEMINTISMVIQKHVTVYELVAFQIGTHPLLTGAPTKNVLIKAAEGIINNLQNPCENQ